MTLSENSSLREIWHGFDILTLTNSPLINSRSEFCSSFRLRPDILKNFSSLERARWLLRNLNDTQEKYQLQTSNFRFLEHAPSPPHSLFYSFFFNSDILYLKSKRIFEYFNIFLKNINRFEIPLYFNTKNFKADSYFTNN